MKKKIFQTAVMLMALAAPFALLTACDDDDDDELIEEVSDTDDDSDTDDSSDDTEDESSSDTDDSSDDSEDESNSDTDDSSDDSEDDSSSDTDDSSDDNEDDSSSDTDDSSTTPGTAIDLGLSVKWSDINIGATLPADYGNYYAWGEIVTKSRYRSDNSVTYEDSSIEDFSGDATYDAATANWESPWRMPTWTELQELINDCTWTWTTQENSDSEQINGYLVTGTNGNSIFLPAAGYVADPMLAGVLVYAIDAYGYYWSSTPVSNSSTYSQYALGIEFYSDEIEKYALGRFCGRSVRPVSD